MLILHTSDSHVGKINFNQDRVRDHDHVFEQIYSIAKDEAVDVILHTGDLFDKPEPGAETLRRGFGYIERLAEVAPVILIAGNHDPDGIFALVDGIIAKRRSASHPIHIIHRETLRQANMGVVHLKSKDGSQNLRIGAVPFVRSGSYAYQMASGESGGAGLTYASQLGRLEAAVGTALGVGYNAHTDIRIFAAHLLVKGVIIGGKDRGEKPLDIETESFGTNSDSIPVADYIAFGHIHKPQTIPGRQNGRYAGSPLAVDFGEAGEEKGVYIVELTPGLPPNRIEFVPLDVGRELVAPIIPFSELDVQGPLFKGKLVKLTVVLNGTERNVGERVRECLKGADIARIIEQFELESGEADVVVPAGPEKTLQELFGSYLGTVVNARQPERVKRYFDVIYTAVEGNSEAPIAEIDAI